MKKIKLFLMILAAVVLLPACEKEIVFDGEIDDPLLVVNAWTSPDSLIKAHVSQSKFFLSNLDGFKVITNADVDLYINGQFHEQLTGDSLGMYTGTYKAVAGDTVRLVVQAPTLGQAESSTIILPKADIISVDTIHTRQQTDVYAEGLDTFYVNKSTECEFRVRFRDPGDQQNYYRMVVKRRVSYEYGEEIYISDNFMAFSLDGMDTQTGGFIDLIGGEENWDVQHLITDELFNGKEFILKFTHFFNNTEYSQQYKDMYGINQSTSESLVINLQSITRDTYLYLLSKNSAENSLNGFFSEPVQIFNNIENGIGIFGSYNNSVFPYQLY